MNAPEFFATVKVGDTITATNQYFPALTGDVCAVERRPDFTCVMVDCYRTLRAYALEFTEESRRGTTFEITRPGGAP